MGYASTYQQVVGRARPGSTIAPTPGYVVHTEAGAALTASATVAQERARLRAIDSFHRSLGWAGFGYSALSCASGRVHEGRGWLRSGAHTQGANSTRHAVCLAGHGDRTAATPAQLEGIRRWAADGVRLGAMRAPLQITGHRDHPGVAKTCPGNRVYPQLGELRSQTVTPPPPPAPAPVDEFEEWFMSLSKEEQDDIRAFARALRSGDDPVSGHQAGTDVRRSTFARRETESNPETDAKFLSELRRGIGGRPTTLVHCANFLRRLGVRTDLPGNNPTGIANRVQLRD